MKILLFNIILLSGATFSYSSLLDEQITGPVCGSLYGYTKTFANSLEFYSDYISSGKLWSFRHPGVCTTTSECKTFNPVCGISKMNNYKTFVNICTMKANQKMSGTTWRVLNNGFCSKQTSSEDTGPEYYANGPAAQLLISHPVGAQKDGAFSETVKRNSECNQTPVDSSSPSPPTPIEKLADIFSILRNNSSPSDTAPTVVADPSLPVGFGSFTPYQTIFYNAISEGQITINNFAPPTEISETPETVPTTDTTVTTTPTTTTTPSPNPGYSPLLYRL